MASEPTITALQVAQVGQQCRTGRLFAAMPDYWALTKPEANLLILIKLDGDALRGYCLRHLKKPLNWSVSVRSKAAPLPAYLAP